MTDAQVHEIISQEKDKTDDLIRAMNEEIQRKHEEALKAYETKLQEILTSTGRVKCKECDGAGAIERLDSCYMHRFGLRTWDGCKACGGSNDKRGFGFIRRR